MRRTFLEVDVFTETAYFGNPVAVVLDASGLDDDGMQRFARWTNLSETTFVLPPTQPEADYRARIFTPAKELPFAGHPTLGTCHAWLAKEAGRLKDTIVQECAAGLVRIRRAGGKLAFAAPPLLRYGPVEETVVVHVAEVLGVGRDEIEDSYWVDNGPGWVAVLLGDAEAVLRLKLPQADLDVGAAGAYPPGSDAAFEVRAFFRTNGATVEDPVTGSLNAALAQWFFDTGRAKDRYVASQGTALGRRGRVHVERDDDGTIWVGGARSAALRGPSSSSGPAKKNPLEPLGGALRHVAPHAGRLISPTICAGARPRSAARQRRCPDVGRAPW